MKWNVKLSRTDRLVTVRVRFDWVNTKKSEAKVAAALEVR